MHIILALDGSIESQAAVREIADLPWKQSPQVTVVTALVDAPYDLIQSAEGIKLGEVEKQSACDNFEAAKKVLAKTGATTTHLIERTHPRQLIIDTANRINADLIVLGARSHSAAYRVVLGSTADYVANHAKCSVLVVRATDHDRLEHPHAFRLLMAYDGSEESKVAFRQMCEFEWPKDETAIHLSMILERPKSIPLDVPCDPAQVQASEATLINLKRTEKIAGEFKQSVHESLHAGNKIRDIAEKDESRLIFIGGTGKSFVTRFFLGSTSRYVLHHAHCSLWIGRQKTWR